MAELRADRRAVWIGTAGVIVFAALLVLAMSYAPTLELKPDYRQGFIRDCAEHRPLADCKLDAKELYK